MAEGGDDREDNPFSFKKFIKAKNKDKSSSDSDIDDSEEDNVVDLLDNSVGSSKANTSHSNRKPDDNPFSFKRFLQSSGGQPPGRGNVGLANGTGIATLDLANDLPDFVQDHYYNSERIDAHSVGAQSTAAARCRSNSRQPLGDSPLPDFALDATDHVNPRLFNDNQSHNSNGWAGLPESHNDGLSRWSHHVTCSNSESLDIRPRTPNGNDVLNRLSSSDVDDNLEFDVSRDTLRHSSSPPIADIRHRISAHSSGGLPDFISDSALAVTASVIGSSSVPNEVQTNGLNNHNVNGDLGSLDASLRRLQEENRDLRRQLREAQELAQQEAVRAAEAVKQMESSQKHEAEETAALERVMQQVEANLESTTQRALNAETVIAKLKQERRSLQSRVENLEAENVQLRSVSSDSVLRDRALYAAQQINSGAFDAEHMLRQLLVGVQKLRLVSDVLSSTDQVTSLPADEGDSEK